MNRLLFTALLAGMLVFLGVSTAQAQRVDALLARIEQLERQIQTLSRFVYRESDPLAVRQQGDTVVLNPPSTLNASDESVAQLSLQLLQLETQVRGLTGDIEKLRFEQDSALREIQQQIEEQNAQITALKLEAVPPRPPVPAAVPTAPATAAAQPLPTIPVVPPSPAPEASPSPAPAVATENAVSPPQPLPVASLDTPAALAATPPVPSPPAEDGKQAAKRYDAAFTLLSQADYEGAERSFRTFVKEHPDHDLAANALYWIAETHYVRDDFDTAAIAFAKAYQDYPEGPKATDNLLKLGLSLVKLDRTRDACVTFAQLDRKFPDAPASVTRRAKAEQDSLGCSTVLGQ